MCRCLCPLGEGCPGLGLVPFQGEHSENHPILCYTLIFSQKMSLHECFYDLVSGRKTGVTATMFRGGLRTLEVPYAAVMSVRNALYDRRMMPIRQFPIPIISVGNLTLGGTGKSPMVAYLCRFFLEQNLRPGLISRGYGTVNNNTVKNNLGVSEGNDEYMEMSLRLPTVPHLQHPNRAKAIEQMLQTEQVDLIILDDAFQHRQVERNTDIVLLDATTPFGFEHIFPRGTLRESLSSLRRADMVFLTRSDLVDESERQRIKQRVLAINPKIAWGETIHVPTSLVHLSAAPIAERTEPIESIRNQSALAFCGIGNPAAFRKTLERCGVKVVKLVSFPDHYAYTRRDIDELLRTAKELGTDTILCTMKDLVKLNRPEFAGLPISAVSIEITSVHL